MIIAVNGWRLCWRRTGVARYLLNVLRHWDASLVPAGVRIQLHLPDELTDPLPGNIEHVVHRSKLPMLVWDNVHFARKARGDVMLCPSHSRPLYAHMPTVVVMHDIVFEYYPEMFPRGQRWLYNPLSKWSARHAKLVITSSEHGQDDIVRSWDVPRSTVRVVYMAANEIFYPFEDRTAAVQRRIELLGTAKPFFFFVGKMTGRRNIPELLRGFARFKASGDWPHVLCLAGPLPSHFDLHAMISSLGLTQSCIHVGYLDDADVNVLYNTAEGYIMPSYYETVSLPVMEAQAAGCPVVCVNMKGLREIAGDGAVYIDRLDEADLAAAMQQLASDAGLRQQLCRRGLESASRFAWRKTAEDVLRVLLEAAR